MIAISLDNLLFLLLIAVAALFQLLSKAISKAGKMDSNETRLTEARNTSTNSTCASRIRRRSNTEISRSTGSAANVDAASRGCASHRRSASTAGACAAATRDNATRVAIPWATPREIGRQSKRKCST